jgi:hypothetical protein
MLKFAFGTSYLNAPNFHLLSSRYNKDRPHRLISDPTGQYDVSARLWLPKDDNLFVVYRAWLYDAGIYGGGCTHIVQDAWTSDLVAHSFARTEGQSWKVALDQVRASRSLTIQITS